MDKSHIAHLSGTVPFRFWQILRVPEVEYISYNTGARALPDIYALAFGRCAYISGKALLPVL